MTSAKAETLDHTHIAKLVYAELDGKVESAGWWAQGVAVAYEQTIGRRQPGQREDGTSELSVTKSYSTDKQTVFSKLNEKLSSLTSFNKLAFSNIRTSETAARLYWRCSLDDGTNVAFSSEQRNDPKAILAVTHTKIMTAEAAATWRSYWKEFIEEV